MKINLPFFSYNNPDMGIVGSILILILALLVILPLGILLTALGGWLVSWLWNSISDWIFPEMGHITIWQGAVISFLGSMSSKK